MATTEIPNAPGGSLDHRSWLGRHQPEVGAAIGVAVLWAALVLTGAAAAIGRALVRSGIAVQGTAVAFALVGLVAGLLCAVALVGVRRRERGQRLGSLVDGLTGLPDRRSLTPALAAARATAGRRGGHVVLTLVDLRNFKAVNEMFGRDDGDLVMSAVADRLSACSQPDDVVMRLAGDEFAIVGVVSRPSDDELEERAVAVLAALSEPFQMHSYTVFVGANIGMSRADGEPRAEAAADAGGPGRANEPGGPSDDGDPLIRRAGMALYRSKRQGPNRFEIYEQALHDQVSPAVVVEWLRTALDEGQLRLAYQPIHSIGGELVVAVEALLRWDHPTEGALLPDVVLPALEDSGLIAEVGGWVIDEACRQARIWRDLASTSVPPMVFVNISPRQLSSADFLAVLEGALDRHGVDASQLCLELGGLNAVPPTSHVWMLLRECKALGVRLALDNFGGNDSSYGLIRRLQFDYIKLGRQLTSARAATHHDDAIAASVMSLARSLDFTTIAEGIEDPASLDRARRLGCDLAQGFYLGVAEPAEMIDQLLQHSRGTHTSSP